MANNNANSSHRPLRRERMNLLLLPFRSSHLERSLKKIEMQLELATRTRELWGVRAKYDRALVEVAHVA